MKIHLLPKKQGFLDLFVDSAQNAVKAAQLFQSLVCDYENIAQKAAEITELEHAGDAITHKIIAHLHRTFITPFDREDIALLRLPPSNKVPCLRATERDSSPGPCHPVRIPLLCDIHHPGTSAFIQMGEMLVV